MNKVMNQYGSSQQQYNISQNSQSNILDQYKSISSSSSSQIRKKITEKQPSQISNIQHMYDISTISYNSQQNSNKSAQHHKENQVLNNNRLSNQIPINNFSAPQQYQNFTSGCKSILSKEVKEQNAGLIKQQTTLIQQQLIQNQYQQQQISQRSGQQIRKSSLSKPSRPQKQSISMQNQENLQCGAQDVFQNEENNSESNLKKQYQIQNNNQQDSSLMSGQLSNQNNSVQPNQITLFNSNTANKSIHSFLQSEAQHSLTNNYSIKNSQNTSSQTIQPTKNSITKDLINYKVLQITQNNKQNHNTSSALVSQITNSQQIQRINSNKINSQPNSYNYQTNQQTLHNSARNKEVDIKQRDKNEFSQQQQQLPEYTYDSQNLIDTSKIKKYGENLNQISQNTNKAITPQLISQQMFQQNNGFNKNAQNIQNMENSKHSPLTSIPTNFNYQPQKINNNYSFHEKSIEGQQQIQQIGNYISNTLNPTQSHLSSNYSSFGTLPKGTSISILKQKLNQQNTNNNQPLSMQSQQHLTVNRTSQNFYSKNKELQIKSTPMLQQEEQENFKNLLNANPHASAKNNEKIEQNYFISQHQNQYLTNNKTGQVELENLDNLVKQYNIEDKEQVNKNQQNIKQQQSLDLGDGDEPENDEYDIPVVPHNHALMQQKYSKRVGISVSAVPDISKISKQIRQNGIKRVGIDMTIHKQMLDQKKNQISSNNSCSMNNKPNSQAISVPSQSTNIKQNTNSLFSNYSSIQKRINSHTKGQNIPEPNQEFIKQGTIPISNKNSKYEAEEISATIQSQKKEFENSKSRLHQQKIINMNQSNAQNQYYLVNPHQKIKNNQNQNMVAVGGFSQNSSQNQMSMNNKEDDLFTNKSERLAYTHQIDNSTSFPNNLLQNEDKPGFQSERFNYINSNSILSNQALNCKTNETNQNNLSNNINLQSHKIPISSHLKIAQQLVQQHSKMQKSIHSSQVNDQQSKIQSNFNKKEKQQIQKQYQQLDLFKQQQFQQQNQQYSIEYQKQQLQCQQQQSNYIENTTNTYYYPLVQQNSQSNLQNFNSVGSIEVIQKIQNTNSIQHQIQNHVTLQQTSQSLNNELSDINQQINNSNQNKFSKSIQNNLNKPSNVQQKHILQEKQINCNELKQQKSHLKSNHQLLQQQGLIGQRSHNNFAEIPHYQDQYSSSLVSPSSTIQQKQIHETSNNLQIQETVSIQSQQQHGQQSINSQNSSKNKNTQDFQSISVGCVSQFGLGYSNVNSNHSDHYKNGTSNPQNQNKNILSTAIKSETTQYSNFTSDSPLLCNENISGILSNRYEDNSQFKNFLSSKSNNISSNNINQVNMVSQTNLVSNQQPSHLDKISNPQIQNYMVTVENQNNQNMSNKQNDRNKISQTDFQNYNSIRLGQFESNNCNGYDQNQNEENIYKTSHKKNLSNHLINKFGAICKVATEGSQQFTQSSDSNSYNKDHNSSNKQNNSLSKESQNQYGDQNEKTALNSKQDTLIIQDVEELLILDQLNQNRAQNQIQNGKDISKIDIESKQLSIEQQLQNFIQHNIMNEDIEQKLKDMSIQELDYLPNPDYFENQKEVNCMMRCILLDWMFEVCMEFMLKRDTLYLSLNYVDRFLTLSPVSKINLQLIGAVSLFIACKIEEIYPPPIAEFAKCTNDGYTIKQIEDQELVMLKWRLNPPTQIVWMNIYTEIWDRFIKTSFEKPNKYQINFVEDQKLSNKKYLILFRIPEERSYKIYRQMTQILDLMQLDINVLRFESRMLIASLMYLQIGIYYKQFTEKQVYIGFSEKYLFANSLNNYNEYFNSFLTQYFSFNLIDILSSLQYVASFFDLEYNYSLSPAANTIDPSNHQMSYEEYISYQTYFPNGIEYIRKRYFS